MQDLKLSLDAPFFNITWNLVVFIQPSLMNSLVCFYYPKGGLSLLLLLLEPMDLVEHAMSWHLIYGFD